MKKYLALLMLVMFSGSVLAQTKITLDEAIKIALQRNSNLIKSENSLEGNKAGVKSAYGDLLPDLKVGGTYNWRRNTSEVDVLDNTGNPTGKTEDVTAESRSHSLSAGGGITLFNGLANFANISKAENDLETARYNLEKLKQDIVQSTSELFYAVLKSEAIMKVRTENVKFNRKQLEQIQEKNKLGSVAVADVYAQQYQLGNAELQLINAENALDQAKNRLLDYLALDVLAEYEILSPFGEEEVIDTERYLKDFNALSDLVGEALKKRADYKGQKLALKSADKGITIARSGYLPSLTGSYGYSTNAGSASELFDSKTLTLGLNLNIPIFSNWNTESNVQMAEIKYLNTQEDLKALERTIKIEVKQGYQDLMAAKKALDVAMKNVTSAEENRRINNERYSLGSSTILDVLQSDRDYQESLKNRIESEYTFYTAKDILMNAIGKLDHKNYE